MKPRDKWRFLRFEAGIVTVICQLFKGTPEHRASTEKMISPHSLIRFEQPAFYCVFGKLFINSNYSELTHCHQHQHVLPYPPPRHCGPLRHRERTELLHQPSVHRRPRHSRLRHPSCLVPIPNGLVPSDLWRSGIPQQLLSGKHTPALFLFVANTDSSDRIPSRTPAPAPTAAAPTSPLTATLSPPWNARIGKDSASPLTLTI